MLRQFLSKRVLITMVVISMALSAFAIWHTSDSYADDMYTTKLVHVGAREEVNWDLNIYPNWEPYSLGDNVNRLDSDGYGPYWAILKTEFEKCGPLTKISLSKEDGEELIELDSIVASDKKIGLQMSDLEAHKDNNGDPLYGLDESCTLPSMSQHDSYWLSGIAGYDAMHYRGSDYVEVYGGFQRNNDKYNQIITFYFNGAEDIPAIPPEVQAVIETINAIGEVTLDKEDAITEACEAFISLTEDQQAQVPDEVKATLENAEKELKVLKAAPVITLIDGIGDITEDNYAQKESDILDAQAAYNALNADIQPFVTNYAKLLEARIAVAEFKLESAKGDLAKVEQDKEKAEQELQNLKDEIAAKDLMVSGLKVTSKAKKFTVKWKKNSEADGYQVQYKLKSAKKYKTLKNTTALKVTSKKLKKGKKYQFKVRTYKNVNGTKVYGKWSSVKTCKCK